MNATNLSVDRSLIPERYRDFKFGAITAPGRRFRKIVEDLDDAWSFAKLYGNDLKILRFVRKMTWGTLPTSAEIVAPVHFNVTKLAKVWRTTRQSLSRDLARLVRDGLLLATPLGYLIGKDVWEWRNNRIHPDHVVLCIDDSAERECVERGEFNRRHELKLIDATGCSVDPPPLEFSPPINVDRSTEPTVDRRMNDADLEPFEAPVMRHRSAGDAEPKRMSCGPPVATYRNAGAEEREKKKSEMMNNRSRGISSSKLGPHAIVASSESTPTSAKIETADALRSWVRKAVDPNEYLETKLGTWCAEHPVAWVHEAIVLGVSATKPGGVGRYVNRVLTSWKMDGKPDSKPSTPPRRPGPYGTSRCTAEGLEAFKIMFNAKHFGTAS